MFLLNKQSVLLEIMNLVRIHIAEKLSVTVNKVDAKFDAKDDRLFPRFTVDGIPRGTFEYIANREWAIAEPILMERLNGLDEKRHGC